MRINNSYYKNVDLPTNMLKGGKDVNVDVVKLQLLIGSKEWNHKILAEKSGISRQTLSCINAGKSCTPIIVCKIAKALEVDAAEILKE